jgi:hypothetical protein
MSRLELTAIVDSRTVASPESSEIPPWHEVRACDSVQVLPAGGNGQSQSVEHPQASAEKPGLSLNSRGRVASVDLRTPRTSSERMSVERRRRVAALLPCLARAAASGGYFRFDGRSGLVFIPYSWRHS